MASLHFIQQRPGGLKNVRLFKKIMTIGRDNTNDLVIPDPGVDPNHAYIVFDGKFYTIHPAGKKNAVSVNGKTVKSSPLNHKDVLTLGDVNMTFDLFDEITDAEDDSVQREITNYRRLYQFTERLMGKTNIEDLLNTLIDTVIEVTAADNGFLILRDEMQRLNFTVARNLNKETIDNAVNMVSDSIISRVISSKKPVIVSDALKDDVFKTAQSVIDLRLSSVMCVPLLARGNFLGIIYLGNNNVTNLFTPNNLQVLEVFAGQAALFVQNAILINELQLDRQSLQERLDSMKLGSLVGSSRAMEEVYKKINKVAKIDIPVLIQGETGTGKELVAKEIHRNSLRVDGPFVVINCGAIPENLLESELFGHKKGSFTGAIADKVGHFKMAHGGTLFLDEIGDMPVNLQVKLLRVLEEHKVVPIGGVHPEDVDIRIVAATNVNLDEAIRQGKFREDLFYRLNVITLDLPPLRDRDDDLMVIGKYFLSRYSAEYGRKIKGFSAKCSEAMHRYSWPGNVRELENRMKKAVIMAEKNLIEPEDLGLMPGEFEQIKPLAVAREEFQIRYIEEVLRRNNGNRTKTAQMLDVDPRTIFRYLERMSDDKK